MSAYGLLDSNTCLVNYNCMQMGLKFLRIHLAVLIKACENFVLLYCYINFEISVRPCYCYVTAHLSVPTPNYISFACHSLLCHVIVHLFWSSLYNIVSTYSPIALQVIWATLDELDWSASIVTVASSVPLSFRIRMQKQLLHLGLAVRRKRRRSTKSTRSTRNTSASTARTSSRMRTTRTTMRTLRMTRR